MWLAYPLFANWDASSSLPLSRHRFQCVPFLPAKACLPHWPRTRIPPLWYASVGLLLSSTRLLLCPEVPIMDAKPWEPTFWYTESEPGKGGNKETSPSSSLFVNFFCNRMASSSSLFCFGSLFSYLLGYPITHGDSLVRGVRWLSSSSSSSAWLSHHTRQATLLPSVVPEW